MQKEYASNSVELVDVSFHSNIASRAQKKRWRNAAFFASRPMGAAPSGCYEAARSDAGRCAITVALCYRQYINQNLREGRYFFLESSLLGRSPKSQTAVRQ
jgi:hypothetical protein